MSAAAATLIVIMKLLLFLVLLPLHLVLGAESAGLSSEEVIKAKIERLKSIVQERVKAGNPPREQEKQVRELESAIRERDAAKAEPLLDELLRLLDVSKSAARSGGDRETQQRLHTALREAQQRKDEAAITAAVAEVRATAGGSLGEPEEAVVFEHPPEGAVALTAATTPQAFAPVLRRIERMKFWNIGLDPAQLSQFPRGVGSVIIGALAARRAGCEQPERLLQVAREAGDFLVWAQEQGGRGVFPMPARRNGEGKVWGIVERALRMAEQQGRYDQVVQNGWCVDDAGIGDDGGLQIENAVCAIGVLHLYEATKDEKYLRAAKAAGDWAIGRPCVPNWNYNSFSVWLLAELHRVTGDARYLVSAKEKTRLGVLPGQLPDGLREGRWLDPHNARPNYHYILTRSLACLLPRLAADDPDRPAVIAGLRRALLAWNPTFPRDGAPNISSASEALALLELRLPDHAHLLGETGVRPALLTLERLGTATLAAGKIPGDPSAWGWLIEAATWRAR